MIGLSISACVKDIAKGKVHIGQVDKIVAGTACKTIQDWDSVIRRYKQTYWIGIENKADAIITFLLSEGKIEQPRLLDGRMPVLASENGLRFWVDSEDQVQLTY